MVISKSHTVTHEFVTYSNKYALNRTRQENMNISESHTVTREHVRQSYKYALLGIRQENDDS